ncbi:MAG: hypothetical protein ACFFFG_18420 [Candidatus Thorarchaeota archaeon]
MAIESWNQILRYDLPVVAVSMSLDTAMDRKPGLRGRCAVVEENDFASNLCPLTPRTTVCIGGYRSATMWALDEEGEILPLPEFLDEI